MNNSAAHHQLKRQILLAVGSLADVRLFDNPRGFDERAKATYGLAAGAGDLIGIVASGGLDSPAAGIFLSLEVKTGKGLPTAQQVAWRDMVNLFGGVARVVRSVADALAAVEEARR